MRSQKNQKNQGYMVGLVSTMADKQFWNQLHAFFISCMTNNLKQPYKKTEINTFEGELVYVFIKFFINQKSFDYLAKIVKKI